MFTSLSGPDTSDNLGSVLKRLLSILTSLLILSVALDQLWSNPGENACLFASKPLENYSSIFADFKI